MNVRNLILAICLGLVVFIIVGFVAGKVIGETGPQPVMGCSCEGAENEVQCGSMMTSKYVFFTALFNVKMDTIGSGVIECNDDVQTGVRYRRSSISVKYYLLSFNIGSKETAFLSLH